MTGQTVFNFIQTYIERYGWAPSYREIGQACDIKSTSNVAYWINKLEAAGKIKKRPHSARTIRIVK